MALSPGEFYNNREAAGSSRDEAFVWFALPDADNHPSEFSIGGFDLAGEVDESDAGADATATTIDNVEGIILAPRRHHPGPRVFTSAARSRQSPCDNS